MFFSFTIFDKMKPKSIDKYDIDSDLLPKVLKVLELIIQFPDVKKIRKHMFSEEVYGIGNIMNPMQPIKSLERHCHDLAVKSIANHRYEEAAKLYWILCQDRSIFEHVLFKIGMFILFNLETIDKNECFLNFFRMVLNFASFNKKEALLEFIMSAIKYQFPDIQNQVKELASRKVMSKVKKIKADSILDAYLILLDWSKILCDNMNVSQSQTNKELVKLKQCDENSDIFILKLIKMLELYDKDNEIESELQNYVESNPDNINAYVYICTYLYHYYPDSDKLLKYLEILSEKSVSDIRTLWLVKIWRKRSISLWKIVKYCFMFLDYPTNGRNIEAWQLLFKNLSDAQQIMPEDDFKSIHSLWDCRRRSWTWMYFNPQHLQKMQSDNKLIAYKVAILLLFGEGKKLKYVKRVSKYHPEIYELAISLKE